MVQLYYNLDLIIFFIIEGGFYLTILMNKLIEVLSSWIINKIDNYDSNLYYENPNYIREFYKENRII